MLQVSDVSLTFFVPVKTLISQWPDIRSYASTDLASSILYEASSDLEGGFIEVSEWAILEALGLVRQRSAASTSRAGIYHYITERALSYGNWFKLNCTCEGFQYNGNCKH